MRIGFLIPTIGCFGSVREMVEVSNVLVSRGHDVTIYHPDGSRCKWLPCHANYGTLADARRTNLDVLIGIIDWQPALYQTLVASPAALKAITLMGFTPSAEMAAILRGDLDTDNQALRVMRDAIRGGMVVLADGGWQLDWMRREVGIATGPAFGGVNLHMFHPAGAAKTHRTVRRVIHSGDPRGRKGGDTVGAAIDLIRAKLGDRVEFDAYWDRRFTQAQLVEFLQQGDVFLDGHRRAGWCNPVAEAMACGTAVVCTDIGAVRDFATDGQTARVVPVDDAVAMAKAALGLLEDGALRTRLVQAGLARIRDYDYWRVVPRLEAYLQQRLGETVAHG